MKLQKVLPLQNNRTKPKGAWPLTRMVCRWHIKRPQPWTWAEKHSRRLEKRWNWQMIDAKGTHAKVMSMRCVPFALYKWKAFGFDGEHKPVWTIADYLKGGVK
jgi:hypothetical protein